MNPKELRERAWTIVQNARAAFEKATTEAGDAGVPAEAVTTYEAALDEAEGLEKQANTLDRAAATSKRLGEPSWRPTGGEEGRGDGPGGVDMTCFPEDTREYIERYARRGAEQMQHVRLSASAEYRAGLAAYLSGGYVAPEMQRALSEGVDDKGGFLVPVDIDFSMLLHDGREPAIIRPLATVQTTTRDKVVLNAVDRVTMTWGAETATVDETDTTFGQIHIDIGKLRGLVKISLDDLMDSAVDLPSLLNSLFAEEGAYEEDSAFIAGDGVSKPVGILAGDRVTRTATTTNDAFVAADILEVYYALPPRYRNRSTWLLDTAIEKKVRLFTATTGDYLWQPGLSGDRPGTLMGRPLFNPETGVMDSTVADAKEIAILGFMREYHIRDRVGTSVQRLDEKYADTDQVGFIVRRRVGGNVGVSNAFRILKVA